MFGGGQGFWSPTENRSAMRAFADSIQRRRPDRPRRSWRRRLAELVAVLVVSAGIYALVTTIA